MITPTLAHTHTDRKGAREIRRKTHARSGARTAKPKHNRPPKGAAASASGAASEATSGPSRRRRGTPAAAALYDRFTTLVQVDVRLSAAANARAQYESGKAARDKVAKTEAAATVALRRAEAAAAAAAAKAVEATSAARAIVVARRPAWCVRLS